VEILEKDYLAHYGILRRSGRYPWGSGGDPDHVRNKGFIDWYNGLKNDGFTDKEIAKTVGGLIGEDVTINELRAAKSVAVNELKAYRIHQALSLKDKGWSEDAIAKRLDISKGTVQNYLKPGAEAKAQVIDSVSETLKKEVAEKKYVDVSSGVEHLVNAGISKTRLDTTLAKLKQEGYGVFTVPLPQQTAPHDTWTRVLAAPGVTQKEVFNNRFDIQMVGRHSSDGGKTFHPIYPPVIVDPKRVAVVTNEDGGGKADGVIYIRPGVRDVSIGNSNYAQVRVAVGPDHFLKGVAVYKEDLPPGIDIEFHTSKDKGATKFDVMKKNSSESAYTGEGSHPIMKATTRQLLEDDGHGGQRPYSAMNIVREEGDWAEWSKNMSSQFLSKQKPELAKEQLDKTYNRRVEEFDEIMSLTNPTVRRKLLQDFAEDSDGAAINLKAASIPRSAIHLILPLSSIKPNEVYAPNYKNGDKITLIRYPHGGIFEIPELTVNNRNREGDRTIGKQSPDAIGIHHSVAGWLSGADFDGDFVLAIPNNNRKIQHRKPLEQLKDFDPHREFPWYEGMKTMTNTQLEMGKISNLITDMSLKEASDEELARAVKHSMVVIDAEKHSLDYKLSEQVNNIKQLKEKYQSGGASTLISRARAEKRIPDQKPRTKEFGGPLNLKTGELQFMPTGKLDKNGDPKLIKVTKLSDTNDAHTLKSTPIGTPMENIYADHSNRLKDLANKARLAEHDTPRLEKSPSAKRVYAAEIDSLKAKLRIAERNRPYERLAQRVSGSTANMIIQSETDMTKDQKKKLRAKLLNQARANIGASKDSIKFTQAEWEAIQHGAISDSMLRQLLDHADMDYVKKFATPKTQKLMTSTKTTKARAMLANGASRPEVAEALGVSLSTLDRALKGES